jgi:hypothetical protein
MLVGSQRNWVNKTSETTEIECWGIVCKFRCYLAHAEFDLLTDHLSGTPCLQITPSIIAFTNEIVSNDSTAKASAHRVK